MPPAANDTSLHFQLPAGLKQTVEEAAALTGQSVNDFGVSALVGSARRVIEEHGQTVLSQRDRDAFIALLDQTDAKPSSALAAAARRYKKHSR